MKFFVYVIYLLSVLFIKRKIDSYKVTKFLSLFTQVKQMIQNQSLRFQQSKNQSHFQSSKNEFLTTKFRSPASSLIQIKSKDFEPLQQKQSNKRSCNFTIHNQFSEFYDPLNDKQLHFLKAKLQNQRKSFQQKQKSNKSHHQDQKPFVEIYQQKNIKHETQFKLYQQEQRKKLINPGPGAYNISKPLVEPVYETIQKNENIVLVKLNGADGTANFRSGNKKLNSIYDKQKLQNPGPGEYTVSIDSGNKKNRKRNKSKLQEYAKNYESNYKFISQVFNSLNLSIESIPNYRINDSSNGTAYNGKPEKLQQLALKVQKLNQLNQVQSRKWLLQKAKSPPSIGEFQRKRSISELQIKKERQPSQIFSFKTVDESILQQKQDKLKIKNQFNQKINSQVDIIGETNLEIKTQQQIKKKFKLIMQSQRNKLSGQKLNYNRKEHLSHIIGYFDGTQKQKLRSKYNVKAEKRYRTHKRLLQPLPKPGRKFQSLDIQSQIQTRKQNNQQKKVEKGFNLNMIDLLFNKNLPKQQRSYNIPNSRISFLREKDLQNKISYSTIQYH